MSKEKQFRGQLTERIKIKSKKLLSYEINQDELQLMVYIQYQMVNEQRIKREHISDEDRKVIALWEKEGLIVERKAFFSLKISKKFWDIINEIVWLGYVDLTSKDTIS